MGRHNELQQWKERLTVAHRKFSVVEPKIKRAWEYYKGNQWSGGDWSTDPYKDHPVDNVVFANIRAIIPRLNFKNPKIFVRPKRRPFRQGEGYFDTIQASAFIELLLNYYYKILDIKRQSRLCLLDALLSPWGIMELGYTLKTEKVQSDELIEINELIAEDSPFCVRRDPKDFRSDPEGVDSRLNDARWIALRWVRSLDDVKKDPRFSNTSSLKDNFQLKTNFDASTSGLSSRDTHTDYGLWGRIEGWDIWDRKTRRIMTTVDEHEKFLRNEDEWPLDLEGFPVETLYFNENSTDVFPIPDTWLYMPMQDELNRVASMQLDHVRRISQRRYIGREGALSPEEMRKLTHGGDGTIAITSLNPNDSVVPLQDATISQDIYIIRQGLKKTIREMAGVSDTEALASTKFEQATEPALIEQAAATIRGDQQAIFENFVVRITEKLATIIQQTADEIEIPLEAEQMNDIEMRNLVEGKLAKIAGAEGAFILLPWLQLNKEDLKGDYLFDIEVGSTMPTSEEARKRDAVSLYQIMKDNPYVKPREGTREVLIAFGKPDPDKFLKTEEEVGQQQQAGKQEALQTQLQLDMPKRQVDLEKTKMKVSSSRDQATLRAETEMALKEMESNDSRHSVKAKVLTEALKARGKDRSGE